MNNEIDNILEKAGRNNKYQYITLLLLFVLFGASEYLVVILPFLEAKPKVEFFDKTFNTTIITTINYTICENFDYKIIRDNTKNSLVYELGIYCDKNLTITLGICLFSGVMIGSSIAYIFADRIGRKKTLLIFSLAFMIINIIFYFIYMLIPVFILIFLSELFSSIINITILVYVSEMAKKQNLILFTTTIFCAFSSFGAIYTVFFYFYDGWRIVLLVVLLTMAVVIALINIYIEESPIFYISHGNEEKFTEAVRNISKKNGRELEDTDLTLTKDPEYDLNRITKNDPFDRMYSSDREDFSDGNENILADLIVESNKIQPLKKELNESSSLDDSNHKSSNLGLKRYTTILSSTFLLLEKQKRKMINDYSIFDLIILDSQRTHFLILSYIWVVMSFMFYGLSIYIKNFYGNIYIQYFIIFLCDMVFSLIGGLLSNYPGLGRKKTMILLLLISFCSFMTSIFFDQDPNSSLLSVCLYISRVSLIALNCIIYGYTNEIYPTVLRTKGLGVNITLGKLGGIIAPFVIENLSSEILMMVFCLINLFAIMLSFLLPETLTRRMTFHPSEMSGIIEENFD